MRVWVWFACCLLLVAVAECSHELPLLHTAFPNLSSLVNLRLNEETRKSFMSTLIPASRYV